MGLVDRFHEGGIFMWFILGFAILSLALIIERSLYLFGAVRFFDAAGFRKQILGFLSRGDLVGAEALTESLHTNAKLRRLARIVEVGISVKRKGGGDDELQARVDEALTHEISVIDRRTGFLAMFGNVATLLGLLGTIVGMIHSFAAVATASPADRATLLSKGISEAMNCTALGLVTAIPALIFFAIFQNRTDRFVTLLTEATTQIYHDLLFFVEPVAFSAKAALPRRGPSTGIPLPTLPTLPEVEV